MDMQSKALEKQTLSTDANLLDTLYSDIMEVDVW